MAWKPALALEPVVLLGFCICHGALSQTWHLVDVPSIVCPGAPGKVQLNLSIQDIALENRTKPHVLTFYRTSTKAVTLNYEILDGLGANIVKPQITELSLSTPTSSSSPTPTLLQADGLLQMVGIGSHGTPESKSDETQERALKDHIPDEVFEDTELMEPPESAEDVDFDNDFEGGGGFTVFEDPELQELDADLDGGRGVGGEVGRRLGKGSSSSSGGGWGGSRSRSTPAYSRSRSTPSYSRSRSTPSYSRSRYGHGYRGYGGSRYNNPNWNYAGSYGYTSRSVIMYNYPMGYRTTSYGYSGYHAYSPSRYSGTSMVLAGAGGVAAGAYIGSRYNTFGFRRRYFYDPYGYGYYSYGNQCYCAGWTGDCYSCYSRCYGGYRCNTRYNPPEAATRDDLMQTGFIPAQQTEPIKLMVYRVSGTDFASSRICPPPGWNPNATLSTVTWSPPQAQDIFVVLTAMEPLDEGEGSSSSGASSATLGYVCLFLLVLCFCMFLFQSCANSDKRRRFSSSTSGSFLSSGRRSFGSFAGDRFEMYDRSPGGHVVMQPVMAQPVMAHPVGGLPNVAQMAHPGMAQPVMAQPVMAQPVMAQPVVAEPQSQQFQVTVPTGCMGGSQVEVTAPTGQQIQVTVPDGLREGDLFIAQF